MRGIGLGMKMAQMLRQKPTRKCDRCGLQYAEDDESCPHCSGLDAAGLAALKTQLEQQHESNLNLGRLFLYLAVLILIGMVLLNI